MRTLRVAIAGAGMAGMSIACALVARGFAGEIVLVDERFEPDAGRTWCWWDVPGVPFRAHASYRWAAWRVVSDERDVVRRSSRHPYLYLRGADFFEAAHAQLRIARVRRVGGERVEEIRETRDTVVLCCASGRSIEADVAVDARGARSDAPKGLLQRFVGRFVRVRDAVFDPTVATLMDFRIGSERPVHFAYVLPFTRKTALIEDTVFTNAAADDRARRTNVERYVREILQTKIVACEGEERGAIPLHTHAPSRPRARVVATGAAGGAIRGSSGYAFVRTQRHATAIANAIATGAPFSVPGRARYRVIDATLLALLRRGALSAERFFTTFFERGDADSLARFLSDASGPGDDVRLLARLLPWTT